MPQTVPIEVFMIGHTTVDREEVKRWLKFIGAEGFDMPDEGLVSNPALLVALAGKRCYKSFVAGLNPNVNKIRADYTDYFDNILKSGHGSVLEHSVYTFAIENVSRVFTGEMNRHRAGWAISEGSMRFIRYSENIPYWEPDSIRGPAVDTDDNIDDFLYEIIDSGSASPDYKTSVDSFLLSRGDRALHDMEKLSDQERLDYKKQISRGLFRKAFFTQEQIYRRMEEIWADELKPESKFKGKKEITSMMRRIVGMGVATGGVWTGNLRALRHVIALRTSDAAEEEILYTFGLIAKAIRDREPLIFGDFVQEGPYWRPKYHKV